MSVLQPDMIHMKNGGDNKVKVYMVMKTIVFLDATLKNTPVDLVPAFSKEFYLGTYSNMEKAEVAKLEWENKGGNNKAIICTLKVE